MLRFREDIYTVYSICIKSTILICSTVWLKLDNQLCGTWFCSVLYGSVSRIPHVPSIDYKATRGHNKNTALTPRWHKKLNSVIYTMELDSEVSMILCSFNFQGHRGVDAIFLNNKNKNLEPLHTIFCSRILGENEFWHKKLLQNGCGTVSLIGEH